MIIYMFVLVVCMISSWTDLRERRIPNKLTLSSAIIGLGIRWYDSGLEVVDGVWGILWGGFPLYFLYCRGGVGGGDVKLMASIGASLGPRLVTETLLWTALSGGVIALVIIGRKGGIRAIADVVARTTKLFAAGAPPPSESETIPYGVCITLGATVAITRIVLYGGVSF